MESIHLAASERLFKSPSKMFNGLCARSASRGADKDAGDIRNRDVSRVHVPAITAIMFQVLALMGTGCAIKNVPIPRSGDAPPTILINGSIVGNQPGTVEIANVQFQGDSGATQVSNATANRNVTVVANASNPGGVESFTMVVTSQSRVTGKLPPLVNITKTAPTIASGLVPNAIVIFSDQANNPINASTSDLAIVQVSAMNFHGQKTTGTLYYFPVDPAEVRNPQIQTFALPRQEGSSLFSGTFPPAFPGSNVRANGHIFALVNSEQNTVHLLPTNGDCSIPTPGILNFFSGNMISDSSFWLYYTNTYPGSGAKLWETNFENLYGVPSQPTFPRPIQACEKTTDPNNPNQLADLDSISLKVVFQFN